MATVTLRYQISVGLQVAANLVAKVAAVVLNTSELDLLGISITSDLTAAVIDPACAVPSLVERTVVLETNAQGDQLFPTTDSLQDATRNLWRSRLNLLVPGIVTADEPVVT